MSETNTYLTSKKPYMHASKEEFDDFLRWIIAMDMKRYFETPCVDLHTLHPN